MFIGKKMKSFCQIVWLLASSLFALLCAEATNKVLIDMIKKTVEDKPRRWHEVFSKVLWAYKNSKSNVTGLVPYPLRYGQDCVTSVISCELI